MEVHGLGPVKGPLPVGQTRPAKEISPPSEAKPVAPRDEVEISSAGKMLETLHQTSEVRAERLAQIKAAIEAGEYETPEKIEAAISRLLAEIESEEAG
jgi:negative regulator of flagellin synthesis FlgM